MRNLERDIIYQTASSKPPGQTEREMPPAKFTAYSGFKFRFKRVSGSIHVNFRFGSGRYFVNLQTPVSLIELSLAYAYGILKLANITLYH